MKDDVKRTLFSIKAFPARGWLKLLFILTGPFIDRILGLHKMDSLYRENQLAELKKEAFVKEVLKLLRVTYTVNKDLSSFLPKKGPLIIVSNHPFGGIEGIILADLISRIRSDLKFMSNSGLRFIREMKEFFIFTNPLVTHNHKNIPSIRECENHLKHGGLLILFPAGRTSFYRKNRKRITDGDWNRIAARLGQKTNTPILPLFFSGHNSKMFINLGRIYYRFRLLMLPREFIKMQEKTIKVSAGTILKPDQYVRENSRETTAFLRMETYLQDPAYIYQRKEVVQAKKLPEIINPVPFSSIVRELKALPDKQHLHDLNNFSVYYGYYPQLPETIREITRLREYTFREMKEGSGRERDTDRFDETYTHLFIVDNEKEKIIGAYRMGEINHLLQNGTVKDIYLTKMFHFDDSFLNTIKTGVEMGRSFLVPEYQKSIYGFFLLWRGIGEFLVRNPFYRTLYGTVSLSNIYDPRSISLIHHVLVKKDKILPTPPLNFMLNPDVTEYLNTRNITLKDLDRLIQTIEKDGKGIPILVRQYHKLGAEFLAVGRDVEFRNTPGMLLRVDMDKVPDNALVRYMGEGLKKYRTFTINN